MTNNTVTNCPRPDLVDWVNNHSVLVPFEKCHLLKEMETWCEEHVGEERPYHPIWEAIEGRIDFHDGDWAFQHEVVGEGFSFWFERTRDQVQFQLTWL